MKHNNVRLAALSRRLNPLWWLLSRVLTSRRRDAKTTDPRSILLVELHLLGDMVMLVPLLRVIRRCHPHAHVGLLAGPWAIDILGTQGLVDEFIVLPAPWVRRGQGLRGIVKLLAAILHVRRRTWDWGIDVRGDVRNGLLLALARARRRVGYDFSGGSSLLTDVVADDGVLRHIVDHHAALAAHMGMTLTADEAIPSLHPARRREPTPEGQLRTLGLHFGASMALRTMPVAEARALVQALLARDGVRLVLIDSPETAALNSAVLERLPPAQVSAVQRWSGTLPEFLRFLETLQEFYAMDSGPAHLAAALGIETTVFFGPHLSSAVRPLGAHVSVIERADLACRPCDQHRCTNSELQRCLTDLVSLLPPRPALRASDGAAEASLAREAAGVAQGGGD